MSAQLHAGVPLADGSTARKLLERLSRSYRMLLVTDRRVSSRFHWKNYIAGPIISPFMFLK